MSRFAAIDVEPYELDLLPSPTVREFFSSPSQVSTYELCARKWAWRYVDGVVAPPNKYAAFGITVHGLLENWFKKKQPPEGDSREAKVARAMIPYLPPPQAVSLENVEVEGGVQLGGIKFVVKQDLYVPLWEGLPTVFDHKTSRTFDYVLAPEVMADDIQASLYGAWALIKSGAPRVRLAWNYGKSEGSAKVHPVRQEVTGGDIRERLNKSIESARETRAILESGVGAIDVPYDASACGAFGGCPYISLCNLTPSEKMESIMNQAQAKQAFADRVNAKKNGTTAAAPQAVNPPVQATAAAAPTPATSPLAAKIAARKAAAEAASKPEPFPVQETPAPEPEPVQAAPEPAEAPKAARGPGRPPKASTAVERWPEFAGIALEGVISKLDLEDLMDESSQEVAAVAAAGVADAMLRQWTQRFGA